MMTPARARELAWATIGISSTVNDWATRAIVPIPSQVAEIVMDGILRACAEEAAYWKEEVCRECGRKSPCGNHQSLTAHDSMTRAEFERTVDLQNAVVEQARRISVAYPSAVELKDALAVLDAEKGGGE